MKSIKNAFYGFLNLVLTDGREDSEEGYISDDNLSHPADLKLGDISKRSSIVKNESRRVSIGPQPV